MNIEPFWMVLADGHTYTRHRHNTRQGAIEEAERLSRADPGRKFFVLQCIGAAVTEAPSRFIEAREIPF